MTRRVAFLHASPAAIAPLMQFYGQAAPELDVVNLLDDGLLRLFQAAKPGVAGAEALGSPSAGERPLGHRSALPQPPGALPQPLGARARERLAEMIRTARDCYDAELAMLTCSAVPAAVLAELQRHAGLPVLKIDEPLAQAAVRAGRRVGVVVTFPPTLETTSALLMEAAAEAQTTIEVLAEVVPEAYQALLHDDPARHDDLLLEAIGRLERRGADVIVLAQVSMARVLPRLGQRTGVPVLSSLETSLAAIRESLPSEGNAP